LVHYLIWSAPPLADKELGSSQRQSEIPQCPIIVKTFVFGIKRDTTICYECI
jgi:hypothetical protein